MTRRARRGPQLIAGDVGRNISRRRQKAISTHESEPAQKGWFVRKGGKPGCRDEGIEYPKGQFLGPIDAALRLGTCRQLYGHSESGRRLARDKPALFFYDAGRGDK